MARLLEPIAPGEVLLADTALRLGQYFGTSAEMWLNLQSQYDLRVAKRTTWPKIKPRIKALKAA